VSLFVSGIILGSLYALLGSGLTIVYGAVRAINIAHGELFVIGMYVTWMLFSWFKISPIISLFVCAIFGFFIGLLVYEAVFRPGIALSRSRETFENNSLVFTFGLIAIFSNIVAMSMGADVKAYSYLTDIYSFSTLSIVGNRVLLLVVSFAVLGLLYFAEKKVRFGHAIRYAVQDANVAQLVGVNVKRVYLLCCGLGFMIASMAGSIASMIYPFTPYIGLAWNLVAWVVIIIGGVGSILGSVVGGLLIGLLETVGVYYLSPALKLVIDYTFLIVVLLIRPRGLFRT